MRPNIFEVYQRIVLGKNMLNAKGVLQKEGGGHPSSGQDNLRLVENGGWRSKLIFTGLWQTFARGIL
ncbi:hypothetical protein JK203_04190 [Gluconobacter cerinus]|uniref:hypothetical protein n=1 Tax=Gluconobacter cerinus TaxID=38307 RepID=UPI001B8BA9A9|nr:hypothetical protein [Gluconobacter cerinus]MBS1040047.1 hypothetical protein [Gluconobacter cerinus]MBS1046986.1 hypothetical protein [Gluconobacter cerinus]